MNKFNAVGHKINIFMFDRLVRANFPVNLYDQATTFLLNDFNNIYLLILIIH